MSNMTHVPYLEELANFLCNCDELDDISHRCCQVKSQYRGMDEDIQFTPSIWIIPGDTTVKNSKKGTDNACKGWFTHNFKVCAVVCCPSSTRNHFDKSIDSSSGEPDITLLGAYMDGADLLCRVRNCILEFNCNNTSGSKPYTPFHLKRIFEPDEHNGALIHCMEYETSFCY